MVLSVLAVLMGPLVPAVQQSCAADREHPELVMENWGERWLSIDVLDESVTSHLRETGKLDPLMGHIERLRVKFGAKPADVE